MKNIFTALTAGAMLFGASTGAFAATSAMDAANQLAPCNGASVVSARYLASGQLEVTCPSGSLSGNAMAGTGLGTSTAAMAAGAVLVLWVVLDDDDDGVSTTTTTTN